MPIRPIWAHHTNDPDICRRAVREKIATDAVQYRVRTLLITMDETGEQHHWTTRGTKTLGDDRTTADATADLHLGLYRRTGCCTNCLRSVQTHKQG
jgi:hypothetical protein